jgi:hypothetical protein
VGWVADTWGPRWSLGVAAASGVVATIIGVRYLIEQRRSGGVVTAQSA